MSLSDDRRKQLDGIVTQLGEQNAPVEDVQAIVKDFVGKYENESGGQNLLSRASALTKPFQKAGEFMFGATGKTVGSLIGQTGIFGQKEKFEEAAQKNITPGNIGMTALETVPFTNTGKAIAKVVLKPLTSAAIKLYGSALKPTGKLAAQRSGLAATGLKERIWLTKGGVEKVANKIDDFEAALGREIERHGGESIPTSGLKTYLNEARKFFDNQLDVGEGRRALAEIDKLEAGFIQKYGKEIPLDLAQKIKVETGRLLRQHYDKLSSAGIEAQKQGVRFLKDEIVKRAPKAGNINARLTELYKFDKALDQARGRLGNLNLLGMASRMGGAVSGGTGFVIGKLLEIADGPLAKSGIAIGLNELSKGAVGGRVVLSQLIKQIAELVRNQEGQEEIPTEESTLP